jgi:uncharacterized membrane protein (UPF0182 family)
MVVPIEESLIYIRPLYLRAQAGRIPELTRVIVAYQNQIVMERTLEAGLARIFGTPAPALPPGEGGQTAAAPAASATAPGAASAPGAPVAPGAAELAAEARATYERALAAQKAGDWAKYGEEIRRLGEILSRMK